jgi:hypothetical protein
MALELVKVGWLSKPYGWAIRHLTESGWYSVQLNSSAPPCCPFHTGNLSQEDAVRVWELVRNILSEAGNEHEIVSLEPHLGYVVPTPADAEFRPYHFYPNADTRLSTRYFVKLLLLLDKTMRTYFEAIVDQPDLWMSTLGRETTDDDHE